MRSNPEAFCTVITVTFGGSLAMSMTTSRRRYSLDAMCKSKSDWSSHSSVNVSMLGSSASCCRWQPMHPRSADVGPIRERSVCVISLRLLGEAKSLSVKTTISSPTSKLAAGLVRPVANETEHLPLIKRHAKQRAAMHKPRNCCLLLSFHLQCAEQAWMVSNRDSRMVGIFTKSNAIEIGRAHV